MTSGVDVTDEGWTPEHDCPSEDSKPALSALRPPECPFCIGISDTMIDRGGGLWQCRGCGRKWRCRLCEKEAVDLSDLVTASHPVAPIMFMGWLKTCSKCGSEHVLESDGKSKCAECGHTTEAISDAALIFSDAVTDDHNNILMEVRPPNRSSS